mgnify:CR=1 FL=1
MKIVFATNNQHKLQEIRDILGSDYEVVSLKEIGCNVDIPETGNTLEENALQKAQYVYDHYHLSCFADDTGLEVEALRAFIVPDMLREPTTTARLTWPSC